MKNAISSRIGAAVAAAGSLTGKRFGLLVASSLVATSAVVAGALTGVGGSDALASLLARGLTANGAPAVTASSPAPPSGGESAAPQGDSGAAGAAPPQSGPAKVPAVEEPAPPPPSEEPAAPAARPEAGPVKHVFVISLTSPGYEAAFGAQSQMPYLATTLRPQGELLSSYTLLSEGSLVNGIAAISGQPPNGATRAGCSTYAEFPSTSKTDSNGVVHGAGCVYSVETLTLADQLSSSRLTWRSYVEGMVDETGAPANCVHPGTGESESATPGGYAARQNPFVYFHSLLDLGDCSADDLPIEELSTDLRKTDKTPNYSFIAPTPCDSGATGQCAPGDPSEGPASADAFLASWVPRILASPAYKADGLLIVTFASVNPPSTESGATPIADPLHVGALLISPFLTPGSTDGAPYNPYSLLRSTEDLFGLDPLGLAAGAKTKSFAQSLRKESGGD